MVLRAGLLAMLFSFFYFSGMSQEATSAMPGAKEARKWMEHGVWRKDVSVKPDHSINVQLFDAQYHKHQDWWQKAMAFLNRKDLAMLAPGTYPIVGKDVFALITEYVPKDLDQSQWESHRKYADIQAVITGEEKIGKSLVSKLTVTKPYDESSDLANYTGPGKYHVATPGTFYIFFPGEGHRPGLKVHNTDTAKVKKLVIKMRMDE